MAVDFSVRARADLGPRMRVDPGLSDRMSPELDVERDCPSPSSDKAHYRSQMLSSELSPSDTPRKNKRKLSEPKRRTTDFSIKRLCPDSPGSVCSESGRSEESTPERVSEESRDSPSDQCQPGGSDIKPPYMFPDMRHHPYFIPQFYYQRFPDPLSSYVPPNSHSHPPRVPSVSHTLHNSTVGQPPTHTQSFNKYSSVSKSVHESKPSSSTSPPEMDRRKNTQDPDSDSGDSSKDGSNKKCRKNYKNMTRERRVEANARERSRVHTISAAFDGLRRAVPSYSYNQKLSKLAILRIACSYINALSKLATADDSPSDSDKMSFGDCVDQCTRTIQTEGKARRRH